MIKNKSLHCFWFVWLAALIVATPLFVAVLSTKPVAAQDTSGSDVTVSEADSYSGEDEGDEPPDQYDQAYLDSVDSKVLLTPDVDQLDFYATADNLLKTAPEDVQNLKKYQVDARVADYLQTLVTPDYMGGDGLSNVKVQRIFKNYTSTGNGQYDREGADEPFSVVSAHNRGQAVDISEVGSITCKQVERSHIGDLVGANKTKWQTPKSVKVAWQSREGIANQPTPHGNSLLEMSGGMTADSIVKYLNDSGEMDAYIDYVKGLTLGDMLTYVGANIYLKNIGVNKVVSDPLADSLIHIIGGAILEKNLPGLPQGITLGDDDQDARVRFAMARLEQGLNLSPGSLKGHGWNQLLESAGKRMVENAAGLPGQSLDGSNWKELVNNGAAKVALKYAVRNDDSFNVINGSLDKIAAGDIQGFRMAGVNVLGNALKLKDDQKTILENAVRAQQTPNIEMETVVTDSQIPSLNLKQLFSDKPEDKTAVDAALKTFGLRMVKDQISKIIPGKYQGLSKQILNQLTLDSLLKLGDLKQSVGNEQISSIWGGDVTITGNVISENSNSQVNQTIAKFFNGEFDLAGNGAITAADVSGIGKKGNFDLVKKIGGAQADKAAGWNPGTGLGLITGQIKLDVAAKQIFANSIGVILGLDTKGISLDGDVTINYGNTLIEERLGIPKGSLSRSGGSSQLSDTIGSSKFYQIFQLDSSRYSNINDLRSDSLYWGDEKNQARWKMMDIRLGVAAGTTSNYLQGIGSTHDSETYSRSVAQSNLKGIAVDKLLGFFGLDEKGKDRYGLEKGDVQNILDFLVLGDDRGSGNRNKAISSIFDIVGRSIGSHGGFSVKAITEFILSPNTETGTRLLLDEGIRLFAKAVGSNLSDISLEDLEKKGDAIINLFTTNSFGDLKQLEKDRQEVVRLEHKDRNAEEQARYIELRNKVVGYRVLTDDVDRFLSDAIGKYFKGNFPPNFRFVDIDSFVRGDFRTGLAVASFVVWQEKVNDYLPDGGKLTYEELRDSIIMQDDARIDAQFRAQLAFVNVNYDDLSADQKQYWRESARKEIMETARKHAEYKISDSFLIKADKTIPVGSSQILFEGTDKERAELLQAWGINHLDIALSQKLGDKYSPHAIWILFRGGNVDAKVKTAIQQLFLLGGQNGKIGPFTVEFAQNLYLFIAAGTGNRADFFTNNQKYGGMWTYFDNWLENTLDLGGLGHLPPGLTKSIYYASQNGWKLNEGTTGVSSLESYGEKFLLSTASSWGDRQLGLKPGTVLRAYNAINGVIKANAIYNGAKTAANSTKLANAQKDLVLFIITTALEYCAACQKFFGSVDRAIAAPPGFTNALVAGALAMAFGLGPQGLYIAAAIYLFGVYKVEYLCPTPPKDYYAINNFDPPNDQLNYGYDTDNPDVITDPNSHSPPFADGNNPDLWMAWSRYYTGKLIDLTMQYGEERDRPYKPLQIMTYRRANAEYFGPRSDNAFGALELNNPSVGLGYTQTTTKLTDWVHVAFGGWY